MFSLPTWFNKPRTGGAIASTPVHDEPKSVALLIVEVRADDIERVRALISECVNLIGESGGTVFNIVSTLIICTFDYLNADFAQAEGRCQKAAEVLRTKLNTHGRVVFGTCEGIYGLFGSEGRFTLGVLVKNMSELLDRLRSVEFGNLERF